MPILSATALKGGTGKTVICQMLAGAFALTSRRILAIDNYPQSSLSTGMLGTDAEQIHPDNTIAAIYSGLDPLPSDVIRPSGIPGVDLIPGSRAADSFNLPDPHLAAYDVQGRLRSFLDEVRGNYDLTIVDNPPNLYAATYAALVAADYCLVPATPENPRCRGASPITMMCNLMITAALVCQAPGRKVTETYDKSRDTLSTTLDLGEVPISAPPLGKIEVKFLSIPGI
jgi:chromosome partitioning protein